MRSIALSNYTAEQSGRLAAERAAQQRAKFADYQIRLQHFYVQRTTANRAVKDAVMECDPWEFIQAIFHWVVVWRQSAPRLTPMAEAGNQERALVAGMGGESFVLQRLACSLSDEWTVCKGYKNKKGETDLVAVGPEGILAIEIKFLKGIIHCCGDYWWRQIFDNYGNQVREEEIKDNGGRSPSRQVNEVADALQQFLVKRGIAQPVARIVVLCHPKGQYGNFQDITVSEICRVEHLDLSRVCRVASGRLSEAEVERVVNLVQKDYEFHTVPRPARDSVQPKFSSAV
jgi:Nuclease-related domain